MRFRLALAPLVLFFGIAAPRPATAIFSDGFESGDLCAWSSATTPCERAIVFVSRQIPPNGTVYWSVPNDLPGVGTYSRFRVAAPGRLQVRRLGGEIETLVDGANPSAASFHLIDVNAPDVSYDGRRIVFAGLPAGDHELGPLTNPDALRLT
jgi:hypothetical protein